MDIDTLYYEAARRLIDVEPAQDAAMRVEATVVRDKRQAYALAFAIMSRADETWA